MYGKKLKKLRKLRGYTLQNLEKELNIPNSTISFWERSKYPSLEGIIKICNFYNMTLIDFILLDEDLTNYLPPGIRPEQIEFLNSFNNLPKKRQVVLLEAFLKIIQSE